VQKDMLPQLADDMIKLALRLHPSPEAGQEAKTSGNSEVKEFLTENGLDALQLAYNIIYNDCEM